MMSCLYRWPRFAAVMLTSALALLLLAGCATDSDPTTSANGEESESQSEESTAVALPELGVYRIVDTGQNTSYDAAGSEIQPESDDPLFGQDAQHEGNQPSYTNNDDGTVTDNVTGLMWSQTPDLNADGTIDIHDKRSYREALASARSLKHAGYEDWRVPSIKELYSLIDFRGTDPSGIENIDEFELIPFIDTEFFGFDYGDTEAGERVIDAQFATSTTYVSPTRGRSDTMFGVNFADGRIKGYPTGPVPGHSHDQGFYLLYVRGNNTYGLNDFSDNGDGTITDTSSGLTWEQSDSGKAMDWEDALGWAVQMNSESHLGYDDWRLPNIKELQSIVDYTRAPAVTNSAAIDPLFLSTQIVNEADAPDAACYWSSTTHVNGSRKPGSNAAYVAFGRAMGFVNGSWLDIHGAGAQRSDPKMGRDSDWPVGRGPQGDAIRIRNYVRLVRDAD